MPSHPTNVVPFPTVAPPIPLDLAELFETHSPYLLRVLHRLTGRADLAEDLAQEVFLVAWKRRDELTDPNGIRTWLYRVAVNVVRHRHRSEGRYGSALQRFKQWLSPKSTTPHEGMERYERGQQVHEVIRSLTEKQREVFVLFELEELEGEEIAQILEIPLNTVWSRLRLARKAFRSAWISAHGEATHAP